MSTHQVFVASYAKDFPWLEHSLHSLKHFLTGFLSPVISVSSEDYVGARELADRAYPEAIVRIRDGHPKHGFMRAQLAMMEGDLWCDADYVWLIGSDCIVHERLSPEQFFRDGLPIMWLASFEALERTGSNTKIWRRGTENLLGYPVAHDYMRKLPLIYPRGLYPKMREHVSRLHGHCFDRCVYRRWEQGGDVSESNLLGGYAHRFCPEIYHWVDLSGLTTPQILDRYENPFLQFWSHGGLEWVCDRYMRYFGGNTLGRISLEVIKEIEATYS